MESHFAGLVPRLGLGGEVRASVRESSYGVDFNYRTLCWGGSVSSPVCVVAGCHSLPLPTAQEICPHPLTEDAEVGTHKAKYCHVTVGLRLIRGLGARLRTYSQVYKMITRGWRGGHLYICPL